MNPLSYPTTVWTIRENMESGADLIPAGSQFWLEINDANNPAYYHMRFDDTKIHPSLQGMNLYPIGIEDLPPPNPKLPPWSDTSTTTKQRFHDAAVSIHDAARKNAFATRLEGSFVLPQIGTIPAEPLIARLYYFAAAETNNHDWIVFDILVDPHTDRPHALEDGTAHGDN